MISQRKIKAAYVCRDFVRRDFWIRIEKRSGDKKERKESQLAMVEEQISWRLVASRVRKSRQIEDGDVALTVKLCVVGLPVSIQNTMLCRNFIPIEQSPLYGAPFVSCSWQSQGVKTDAKMLCSRKLNVYSIATGNH